MKISKKSCVGDECVMNIKDDVKECVNSSDNVETTEDINDVQDESTEDIEAKKNLGLAKEFYTLAAEHVNHAIDALGDAASNGDKYAKQEIADLSVILLDLKNLQRM